MGLSIGTFWDHYVDMLSQLSIQVGQLPLREGPIGSRGPNCKSTRESVR